MTLTLDNHPIVVDRFYENLSNDNDVMNVSFVITVGRDTVFQDISQFDGLEFSNMTITNTDGVEIPVLHNYTKVTSVSCSYEETSRMYSVNIILE